MAELMVGAMVHYRLTQEDSDRINSIKASHPGNAAAPGDTVPLIITRIEELPTTPVSVRVSGQAILDGRVQPLFIQSINEGTEYGSWGTAAPYQKKAVAAVEHSYTVGGAGVVGQTVVGHTATYDSTLLNQNQVGPFNRNEQFNQAEKA